MSSYILFQNKFYIYEEFKIVENISIIIIDKKEYSFINI